MEKPLLPYPQCGDILLICGRSILSTLIAKFSAEEPEAKETLAEYSHAGFVIAGAPIPLMIEAVMPRVRVVPVAAVLTHADHATLMRPCFLAGREAGLVVAACNTVGHLYGLTEYPGFIADAVFHTDKFSQFSPFNHQVCSQHVGLIYNTIAYTFGEAALGLTPNELALWGMRHPEEWDMIPIPL
jgi:hypothetical protein